MEKQLLEQIDDLAMIVKKLQCMNLRKVARQVPIHYMTIYKIANGVTTEPNYRTVQILKDFLRTV
jgi:predicted transcriptional regulator